MSKIYAAVAKHPNPRWKDFSYIGVRSDNKEKVEAWIKDHKLHLDGKDVSYHVEERSEKDDILSSIAGVQWL